MKGSIIIVSFFVLGVFSALNGFMEGADLALLSKIFLYVLMFFAGLGLGMDKGLVPLIRKQPARVLLLPLCTMAGTFAGVSAVPLFFGDVTLTDSLALGAGFGYYSLSSIFIGQVRGPELATIALAANVIREILTLLFAPLMSRYFGKLAPISAGGATTADTTLPVIVRSCGNEYVPVAVFHGVVMDISVPFFLTLIFSMY